MSDMLKLSILALGPLVAMGVGWALLWIASSLASRDKQRAAGLLRAGGAVLLIAGACFGMIVNTHIMSLYMLVAALIIGGGAVTRFYVSERQSLLWVLTVAAERGIPLETAARAFAEERHDFIGRRANLLAEYLEAGVPLALALSRSRCSVSSAAQLAAGLGQQTGTLGVGLRQATDVLDVGETTLRELIEKLFYLIFLLTFGGIVLTFIMLKIGPVIAKLMEESGIEVPELTLRLNAVIAALGNGWIGGPLVVCTLALFVLSVLCYLGVSPRQLPIVSRLWWSADCALVLHWLSIAVRHNQALGEMVRLLAAHFPQPRLRKKLERASIGIDRGQDWREALRATGVFRGRECSLFKSAEHAGNLAWALEEMAQSGIRRSAYRIRGWTNVVFPILICGAGAVVLFVLLGMFLPLVALISGLSPA